MARTPASAAASRIRIEDEVWEEAFSSRVPARRGRASASPSPGRPARSVRPVAATPLRVVEPVRAEPPSVRSEPVEVRRTVRIQGRGADPLRSEPLRSVQRPSPVVRSIDSSPDRLAMWAALLGFLLVAVAILSSHF